MAPPLLFSFVAGASGEWRIDSVDAVVGDGLSGAERLAVLGQPLPAATATTAAAATAATAVWTLRGTVSNTRYTQRQEVDRLNAVQQGLGRPQATRAALIPIRKTAAWWALAQDERRAIFEAQSRHIEIGMAYLPPIARRLHHSRDLGEPFDFLTWFEYAPQHGDAFEEMVARLRQSREWQYVDREVDIRLCRA